MLGTAGWKAGEGGSAARCPSTAGLPKEQHGPAAPTPSSLDLACGGQACAQHSVLLSLQPLRACLKNPAGILLWSQWITHILKALISLARQTACTGFHTKGRDIVSAVSLALFSDRNEEGRWDRWSGLCKWKLETQNKSFTEWCG